MTPVTAALACVLAPVAILAVLLALVERGYRYTGGGAAAPEPVEPVADDPEWIAWRDHLLACIAEAARRDAAAEAERAAEQERLRQAFAAAHYAGVWYTTPEELAYLWSER